ncbi:L,D-transpeptidase family protein [Aquibium sp. A9E412]|uniref:L,D-transpeptidase family protein n=1 Tax=Aquibium sp. A9E412 TaxID=2976767 RepID=UPI0025B15A7D|nr:L,D-transpeptidase family protein [Aquibium sp. A9E412]MDN2566974.1 L,D-transpeptidase family protein [Aquibium sp. A9E412]
MTRTLAAALVSLLAASAAAAAQPLAGAASGLAGQAPGLGFEPVQLREFDVYIDQYGREIVVDPYTGEVVEIRPPRRSREEQRRAERSRELDRRVYDFTDPADRARYRRDRDVELGRREPPRYDDRTFRDRPVEPYRIEPYRDDFYDDDVYGDPPVAREEPYREPPPARDTVRRAPLAPPEPDERPALDDEEAIAAVPEPGEEEAVTPRAPRDSFVEPAFGDARQDVAAFQVLLDRAGASPGVIDGRIGSNVNKAIDAYKALTGQTLRTYDKEWIEAQLAATGGPAFVGYEITAADAAGPYIASVPSDYGDKARLERLSFTSTSEMLAERFHMDEDFLKALNPQANFNRPGTIIRVANPGKPIDKPVARIVADKGMKQVRAYDESGDLVAVYPATIGSQSTPSPTGTHTVERIAFDPEYTYNPKINFKQGDNDEILTIPPGPNGPVGSIWIALSKPTYGIHGTPDPDKIGKTYSNGCVRLTNWDAQELAKIVKPGVTVAFAE